VGNQLWNQGKKDILGDVEASDQFGSSLGSGVGDGGSSTSASSQSAPSQIDSSSTQRLAKNGSAAAATSEGIPSGYDLAGNYPNPFNPSTTIEFSLPEDGLVSLKVYNLVGREVASILEQRLPAGVHHVKFDAQNLPSGTYLYRMQAGAFKQTRTMTLMK
jgi:hypothetical protein